MKKNNNIKGIALLEALISITIILTSILAPMTVIIGASNLAEAGVKRIQATYLAIDGAEMLLNYRKTLNIFCFQNSAYELCSSAPNSDLSISAFNQFHKELIDEQDTGVPTCTRSAPCIFDDKSFTLSSSPASTDFINDPACGYLRVNDMSKTFGCSGATQTMFYRYMYIEEADDNAYTDGSDAGPASLLITTVVCFDRSAAECLDQLDFKNKVIIKNYVSK